MNMYIWMNRLLNPRFQGIAFALAETKKEAIESLLLSVLPHERIWLRKMLEDSYPAVYNKTYGEYYSYIDD